MSNYVIKVPTYKSNIILIFVVCTPYYAILRPGPGNYLLKVHGIYVFFLGLKLYILVFFIFLKGQILKNEVALYRLKIVPIYA